MRNIAAQATEVRPVRPPSATPAEDSTKVVTVEVPQTAPEAGRNSVRQHRLFHTGNIAVLVEQAADGAGAEQRAEGIEHIDHAESKHGADEGENKAAHAVGCDPCGEVKALGKHGARADVEEVLEQRNRVEGQACCKAVIEAGNGETEEVVKNGTADDAPRTQRP